MSPEQREDTIRRLIVTASHEFADDAVVLIAFPLDVGPARAAVAANVPRAVVRRMLLDLLDLWRAEEMH
jgi:hypothetical protein